MVKVRYHFVVYIKNDIPVRVEYTTSTGVVCGEAEFEAGMELGCDGRAFEDKTEYYAEFDELGIFAYVGDKSKKIIKDMTRVWDMVGVCDKGVRHYAEPYKPKSTIKYINQ